MTIRRLLAVTHETTITGAPMNLLHLVRWITEHTDIEVHVLALQDGALRDRFEAVTEVTVLDRSLLAGAANALQQGLLHLGSSRAWRPVAAARLLPQLRSLRDFDVVYLNSLGSLEILPYLPPAGLVVSHVHELGVATTTHRPHVQELLRSAPDLWIAAADAVRDVLVDEVGLPADAVHVHHEFIDAAGVAERVVTPREVSQLRRSYSIPADAAIVMGAGTIDWRKGPDLFIQLATEVRRRTREPVHFVWIGGDLETIDMVRLHSDMARASADNVLFAGIRSDPVPWFAAADVFVLTSREDPFPLVCLEHAAMGHPIVTYRNGGMPELLEAAGPAAATGVVDYLDVGAMAEQVLTLLEDEQLRLAASDQLRQRVLEHHDVSVAAPALLADLEAAWVGIRPPPSAT
jgi:glycosyltransferase involved in cell wall biosynthesis